MKANMDEQLTRRIAKETVSLLKDDGWESVIHEPKEFEGLPFKVGIWFPELRNPKLGVKLICCTPDIPENRQKWLCGQIDAQGSYPGAWNNDPQVAVDKYLAGDYPCGPKLETR